MSRPSTGSPRRVHGVLLGGLAAVGVLSAFGCAPSAEATCISAFGLGGGPDCTSTIASIAIALGPTAGAHANGLLGAAFAFGTNAIAYIPGGAVGNLAVAGGDNSMANAEGYASAAIAGGINSQVQAGGSGMIGNLAATLANKQPADAVATGIGNIALNVFGGGGTAASGYLNSAVNLGGTGNSVFANGLLNSAVNLLGNNNQVSASSPNGARASWAFSVFGSGNAVTVGPGPLAVAGSIAQTGKTITRVGPGITINGLIIGSSAAVTRGAAAVQRPVEGNTAGRTQLKFRERA